METPTTPPDQHDPCGCSRVDGIITSCGRHAVALATWQSMIDSLSRKAVTRHAMAATGAC